MITTAGDALLADIIACPDDDTPRLIFADWLEDNGEPERAEFIRLSVRSPKAVWTRLVNGFGYEPWINPLSASPSLSFGCWAWNRGFVFEIHCTLRQWLDHGRAICAAHPIKRVELTDRRPAEVNEELCWWAVSDESHFPAEIPLMIWSLIDLPAVRNYWKVSPTREGAVDALSAALIRWGRSR